MPSRAQATKPAPRTPPARQNPSADPEGQPLNSDYRVVIGDSRHMNEVEDASVHLIVTSPPYPMVSIWAPFFAEASAKTYDTMHQYLDQTWRETSRVLVQGGIAC